MTRLATILIALSLLLTACCPLTSEHPLVSPADATIDQRLAGTWKSDGEDFYFHMGQDEGNRMKVMAVEFTSSSKFNHALFSILLTEINKKHYIDIDLSELSKDISLNHEGHIFTQYDLPDADTLVFSSMNQDVLTEDIRAKRLAGTITYRANDTAPENIKSQAENRKIECVHITDSTPNIRKYLGDEGTAKLLFKEPVTMHRVKTKKN